MRELYSSFVHHAVEPARATLIRVVGTVATRRADESRIARSARHHAARQPRRHDRPWRFMCEAEYAGRFRCGTAFADFRERKALQQIGRPTANTQPGLIQVLGREVNRRDALLTCGLCGSRVQIHFYEPPGEPLLDGRLLWAFHFDKCPNVSGEPIGLRLMWDIPGRPTENLTLDPKTHQLSAVA